MILGENRLLETSDQVLGLVLGLENVLCGLQRFSTTKRCERMCVAGDRSRVVLLG